MGKRIDRDARFRRLKTEAKQEVGAQKQEAQEALKRRFASLGMQASGEAIKQEQVVEKAGSSALNRRLEGIQGMQEEEALRQQEIDDARSFQRGEREAQQAFASSQNEKQLAQQAAQFEKQYGLSKEQALQAAKNAKAQTDAIKAQTALSEKEFEASIAANQINALLSGVNSNLKPGQMRSLMKLAGIDIDKNGMAVIGGTPIDIGGANQQTANVSGVGSKAGSISSPTKSKAGMQAAGQQIAEQSNPFKIKKWGD